MELLIYIAIAYTFAYILLSLHLPTSQKRKGVVRFRKTDATLTENQELNMVLEVLTRKPQTASEIRAQLPDDWFIQKVVAKLRALVQLGKVETITK